MTDRTKLETLFEQVVDNLTTQVKSPDCPAGVLAVARAILKDNGIEARRTNANPLGALADSLPTFDRDDADDLDNIQH